MWFYEIINNNGEISENTNITPLDKIKIYEYEVERSRNIVTALEKKLEQAKLKLEEDIKKTNDVKVEGKKYLKDLLKEIK